MKPSLLSTTLSWRSYVCALGMTAALVLIPMALGAKGLSSGVFATQDNAKGGAITVAALNNPSPEVPWFLKPVARKSKDEAKKAISAQQGLKFTENRGQLQDVDGSLRSDVAYYSMTKGMKLYFTKNSIGYVFNAEKGGAQRDANGQYSFENPVTKFHVMEMNLIGSNSSVTIEGADQAKGLTNVFKGRPDQFIMDIPSYHKLVYNEVYKNIDLVVYTQPTGLKYDFVVKPGGNPADIRFRYNGAEKVSISSDGKLQVTNPAGRTEEQRPYSYQGEDQEVSNAYRVSRDGVVSFKVGAYDNSKTLVIDPIVIWSTYFGFDSPDFFNDVALTNTGLCVAVGVTESTTISSADLQALDGGTPVPAYAGGVDGVIAVFDVNCDLMTWGYFGGAGGDQINSVDIESGRIYIMGFTTSRAATFPVLGAVQATRSGGSDSFIACFSLVGGPASLSLNWSSYRGGSNNDVGTRLSVRTVSGTRYIAGTGYSNGTFPSSGPGAIACGTVPLSTTGKGAEDAFVYLWTENGAGTAVTENWSTNLGGGGNDRGWSVEIDSSGEILIGGHTESNPVGVGGGTFPARNGGNACIRTIKYPVAMGQGVDGYVGKFSFSGCLLILGYIGGSGNDFVVDGSIDSDDNYYVTGRTLSDLFSGTEALPIDGTRGQKFRGNTVALGDGNADAFLTCMDNNCCIDCSTYHGGAGDDMGEAIDVIDVSASGGQRNLMLAGTTTSTNMPVAAGDNQCSITAAALAPNGGGNEGGSDIFAASFSEDCCRLWSTYWGGTDNEQGSGIAVRLINGKDRVVVCGQTTSTDYPTMDAGGFYQAAFEPDATSIDAPDGVLLIFEFRRDEKLSIELAAFGATPKDRRVNLSWRTASEENNVGFELQRAELQNPSDPVKWQPIASYLTHNGLVGLGTNPVGAQYSYSDSDPWLKVGYNYIYRLIDVSTDGTRTPHPSVAVMLSATSDNQKANKFFVDPIMPNPVRDESANIRFNLEETDIVTMEIYSVDGKKISTPIDGRTYSAGEHSEIFSVESLQPGVYTAVIRTKTQLNVRTRQFVVYGR